MFCTKVRYHSRVLVDFEAEMKKGPWTEAGEFRAVLSKCAPQTSSNRIPCTLAGNADPWAYP